MRDRVAGAPGQYKANLLPEELQKMQAGEEFTITMARDDQPIEEGTPYSKATVLPDEVANQLCPGKEDPTPADAFDALARGFVSYHECGSLTALNDKIDALTKAQPAGTEKTYYIYFSNWTEVIPGGRWSVTIHKPDVSDPEMWAGVTVTVIGSKAIYKLQRELYAGGWLEWEWENPPMIPGVIYRTTERFEGEAVYTALIDCGKMPNNAHKSITHGIGMHKVIRYGGYAGTTAIPVNMYSWLSGERETVMIDVTVSTTAVYIKTNYDASADSGKVSVWFTRA